MTPRSNVPLLVTLFAILLLIASSFTFTIMAAPYIVSELGGDRTMTTYPLAFFGFGTAITLPLARPGAAKWGPKPFFFYSLVVFAFTNLLCALAPTFFLFNLMHLFAGMAVGPIYPMLPYFFPNLVSKDKGHVLLWVFITVLVSSPVLGACWGGTIAYLYHWQAPYYGNIFLTLLLLALARHFLQGVDIPTREAKFDAIGWTFYAIGILSLTFACTTAQQLDWYRSPLLIAATLIGTPSLLYFFLRNALTATPLIDLRLLKKPLLALAMFAMALIFALYYGFISLLALWLLLDAQFTPNWVAALLSAMALTLCFPYFIIEWAVKKIDPRTLLLIALIFLAASCFYTTIFDTQINLSRIIISRVIAGIGLSLFLPPILQIFSTTYAPIRWVEIFEIFQVLRNLGSSLGAVLFSITWQRRTVFFHERLGERLQWGTNPVETFFHKVKTLDVPGDPVALLNYYLEREASSLALDDVFYLMGWILVGLFVMVLLTFIFRRDTFRLSKVRYSDP